jgi:GTP-binding protein HflX
VEADVILHVRDVSHDDAEAQLHDVEKILLELGIDTKSETGRKQALIEVWNKIDRLDADARAQLENIVERRPQAERPVPVSAVSGEGIDTLAAAIEARLAQSREIIELDLDPADGAGMSWLHRHTEVMSKTLDDHGRIAMTVRATPDTAGAVRAKFAP